ncbi:MAG: aminotransferase class III-fold pyridoxal phosphate-dependent enzyme [Candidatus Saccharicenans sp.]|jgi:4-aminobutyrate aminotransferase-like enzyme|nr:aminotransferase class III-fold pyridoxal phosphate-dependent enzyme [Candidatus Saccharicenans sp.]MDH7574601.1 aminotransferase class III-fold pyridoxal phosphate-dependent enzyme [Candidatus Saccharicenans sp.]
MTKLEYRKPCLPEKDVELIISENFGLRPERLEPLNGDRSQNFLVRKKGGQKLVLKVSSEFDREDSLDFENQVLLVLNRKLAPHRFPRPVPDTNGQLITSYTARDRKTYLARLFEFVEGTPLAAVRNISGKTWAQVGRFLARVDLALKGFYHPGQRRLLPWDVRNVLFSRERFRYIADPAARRKLDYCLLQYENLVLPEDHRLRKQVIYGDANEHNILLEPGRKSAARVIGLIDFGDATESFLAAEPALALTYALMLSDGKDREKVASQIIGAYHSLNPLKKEELDLIFYLILARLVVSLTMAAWRRSVEPGNTYMRISEEPGWKLLDYLLSENPEKWRRLFYRSCGFETDSPADRKKRLLAFRHDHVSKALSLSYRKPLHIIRGAGQFLFDSEGRSYLDCVNNVCHLGHAHPAVARAVARQMTVLNTNTRYLYDQMEAYVESLLARFPRKFTHCFLVNSGSEANDLALRLARNFTGGTELLVIDGAYHGNLTSLVEVSPYKFDGPGGKGAPPFVHKVPTPDPYRGLYRGHTEETAEKYAAEVDGLVAGLLSEKKKLVGLMAESMMGCAGQVIFPPRFLKKAFEIVRAAGGLAIADEVQVGFGRPGYFFWGFESQEAMPDIVTLGKPIGNGHPIGAVITTAEIAGRFATGMEYFNTFGGNPVSCAAGLAVLRAIDEENLQENARVVGDYFLKRLRELQRRHPLVGDVRGLGLFIGVELVRDRKTLEPATDEARAVIEEMKDRGVLLSTDGPFRNVIKIKPPVVFTRSDVDRVIENLDPVLRAHD